MTKQDDGDDDGANDGNEDKNDNNNAAAGSGSDGPIFDPITTPRSRLILAEEESGDGGDGIGAAEHYSWISDETVAQILIFIFY